MSPAHRENLAFPFDQFGRPFRKNWNRVKAHGLFGRFLLEHARLAYTCACQHGSVITDESLHKFEGAQLANLCPAEVEVAKAYIPR